MCLIVQCYKKDKVKEHKNVIVLCSEMFVQ